MKVNKEELAQSLAKEVAKLLIPKIKRVVREEVDYSFSKLLREHNRGGKNLNSVVDFGDEEKNTDATKIVAERKKEAREAVDRKLQEYYQNHQLHINDDPYAQFIATAEDPEADRKMQEQIQMSQPKKKLSEATEADLADPMNIDFGEVMERI